MPRIVWENLPVDLEDHLFVRARERGITALDLGRLLAWRKTNPDAAEGAWWKDFGSFKLCGEGALPKAFLTRGQAARGQKID
jgi:hypothetical protein